MTNKSKPGSELVPHTEETAIAPVPLGREIDLNVLVMAEKIGTIAFRSGMSGNPKPESAIFKILIGYELGIPMMSALKVVYAIKTKSGVTMALAPKAALGLIYNSRLVEDFNITDLEDDKGNPVGCTVSGNRIGENRYEATFTLEDAERAGLIRSGGVWETYPGNMCRWRAVGFWADAVVPDLTLGLMRTTDLTDKVDADGIPVDIIDVTPTQTSAPQAPAETERQITLIDLMQTYDPAEILAANNDIMPSATDDLEVLITKLKKE